MTGDPIDRLRHADPVRGGGEAARFEDVMDWIRRRQTDRGQRSRLRRPRWSHAVAPALGTAAIIAVAAVVVIAVGAHHRPRAVHPARPSVAHPSSALTASSTAVPSPVSLLPASGGMRGLVFAPSLFGSGSTLQVSFVQCTNCRGETTPPNSREVNWSATSTDDGAAWRVAHERVSLSSFGMNPPWGRDVWASGFAPHAGDMTFFVSHNSGRTYVPASAPTKSGYAPVTVGDGVAWTLGTRCVHYACASVVLHGQVTGSSLTRTATEPPGLPTRHAPTSLVVAGYGDHGYVSEGGQRRFYVSADDGHSWSRVAYPCAAPSVIRDLTPSGQSVWVLCASPRRSGGVLIRRSADGGRSWQTPNPAFHRADELVAASPQVAWAQMGNLLERTTDGGRSWQTILTGAGPMPSIDIESPTHAAVVTTATTGTVAAHTRRTDLVAYVTADGGSRWTHAVIRLPTG